MAKPNGKKAAEPATPENGEQKRAPVRVLSYQIGKDTFVQASIWDRKVEMKDGSSFLTYDVSIRKRYKDAETGEWKSLFSFHGSELYAVVHAILTAAGTITELRAADVPF